MAETAPVRTAPACGPPTPVNGPQGWQVEVEVVVLRLLPDGALGHRWVRAPVPVHATPDERAVEIAGCADGVCHSTSWRWAGRGALCLTYAVLPDPEPRSPAEVLPDPLVVVGGAALAPTPSALGAAHVAAHAVRHLADLAERDPEVRGRSGAEPLLWRAVLAAARQARHEPALAAPRR